MLPTIAGETLLILDPVLGEGRRRGPPDPSLYNYCDNKGYFGCVHIYIIQRLPIQVLQVLEDTARYAEGFGLRPRLFFALWAKKELIQCSH